eukprot:3536536-Amphidinium_carterae.1
MLGALCVGCRAPPWWEVWPPGRPRPLCPQTGRDWTAAERRRTGLVGPPGSPGQPCVAICVIVPW